MPFDPNDDRLAPPMDLVLGARQFPNPNGIAPRMDTEGPPPTQFSGGAKLSNIPSAKLNEQGDISSPLPADVQPEMMREASAHDAAPPMEGTPTPQMPTLFPEHTNTAEHRMNEIPAPADAQQGQAAHAAKMRVFGDAKAHLDSQLLKSPDEFANPTDYTKHLESVRQGLGAIKEAQAEYELSHPWGSMESSHPGVFGKIGHAFGEIGNVAGEALAPGLAEAVPGSRSHILGQEARGAEEMKAATAEQGMAAGTEMKEAAAEKNAAQAAIQPSVEAKNEAQAGLANEKQDQLSQATPAVDKQVFAAGQRIAAGQGTDKDFAMVQSYHQLQQMKREATMKNAPANIKTEYEQAVKDGDDAKAAQLLKIAHDYATATQPPQRSPQELVVTPEGKAQTIREGSTIEPGTKSAKDAMKGATADETRRADLARNMNENLDQLQELLKKRPDMFGPVAGRWTQLKQLVGTEDADVAAAHTIKEQMGMAMVGAHAMRNAQHVEAAANSIINSFKNGPEATQKAIDQARNSLATFQQDAGEQPGSAPKNAPKGKSGGKEIHYKIVNGQLVKQ